MELFISSAHGGRLWFLFGWYRSGQFFCAFLHYYERFIPATDIVSLPLTGVNWLLRAGQCADHFLIFTQIQSGQMFGLHLINNDQLLLSRQPLQLPFCYDVKEANGSLMLIKLQI